MTATTTLPLLARVSLEPLQRSEQATALRALKLIEKIEIQETVKQGGGHCYAIRVFNKHSKSRIPICTTTRNPADPTSKPDHEVLRRFSEFNDLCGELYVNANTGHQHLVLAGSHGGAQCAFCRSFTDYLSIKTQPGVLMRLLHSQDEVRVRLERLLNDMLQMTIANVRTSCGNECLGQTNAPLLLLLFLLPDVASELNVNPHQPARNASRTSTTHVHAISSHAIMGM